MATFTAATVPVEREGDGNPLLDQAIRIGMSKAEREAADNKSGTAAEGAAQRTDQTRQADGRITAQVDPKVGSFEAFMSTFGAPRRWAGG